MADDSMFRCAGLGLDSVLQFGSLGSYDGAVVRKQFAFPDGTELPELVPALVNRSGASPFVSVGLMPPGTTPQQCQLALGDTPLVVLATHADRKSTRLNSSHL